VSREELATLYLKAQIHQARKVVGEVTERCEVVDTVAGQVDRRNLQSKRSMEISHLH
jgi:hypothetical protein